MKIQITKEIKVSELLERWQEIFSDPDHQWEFNADDWETVSNTIVALNSYYEKYGDNF